MHMHWTEYKVMQTSVYPSGVSGSAYRRAEFTRERYCACATYLLVELVNVAHLMWAEITSGLTLPRHKVMTLCI